MFNTVCDDCDENAKNEAPVSFCAECSSENVQNTELTPEVWALMQHLNETDPTEISYELGNDLSPFTAMITSFAPTKRPALRPLRASLRAFGPSMHLSSSKCVTCPQKPLR